MKKLNITGIKKQETISYDGSRISFRDTGNIDGHPLFFLPGWACVQEFWDATINILPIEYRCITLDFAGAGSSTAGKRQWTIENFARDVRAVLNEFDLANVALIGHSMGGAVALETAYLCHRKISRVIGCDSFTNRAIYTRLDERAMDETLNPLNEDFPANVRSMLSVYFIPQSDPAMVEKICSIMAGAYPEYAVPAMEHLLRWDVNESVRRCPVPIASINSHDLMDKDGEKSLENLMEIITIKGAGHFLMLEKPEEFSSHLISILCS
jgi:pimeloyl-ACP methyl ester carboxylesterase